MERKRADWPHWPDRSNGPARLSKLERKLFHDSEREAEIEQAQKAVRELAFAAAAKEAQIEQLERAVAAAEGSGPEEAATHLVFVPASGGYALQVVEGSAPAPGGRIVFNGSERVVAKLGPSPLPGDDRRCAYLDPA